MPLVSLVLGADNNRALKKKKKEKKIQCGHFVAVFQVIKRTTTQGGGGGMRSDTYKYRWRCCGVVLVEQLEPQKLLEEGKTHSADFRLQTWKNALCFDKCAALR